jgi:hypothetical protein
MPYRRAVHAMSRFQSSHPPRWPPDSAGSRKNYRGIGCGCRDGCLNQPENVSKPRQPARRCDASDDPLPATRDHSLHALWVVLAQPASALVQRFACARKPSISITARIACSARGSAKAGAASCPERFHSEVAHTRFPAIPSAPRPARAHRHYKKTDARLWRVGGNATPPNPVSQ